MLFIICMLSLTYFGFGNATNENSDLNLTLCTSEVPFSLQTQQTTRSQSSASILDFLNNNQKNTNQSPTVLLGGYPIGLNLKTDGLLITGKIGVVTKDGAVVPTDNTDITSGDLLIKIDDKLINSYKQIQKILNDKNGASVKLTINRAGNYFDYEVTPAKDVLNGNYRIGLSLQDNISGIGTLTFINPKNNRFASLGHAIALENGYVVPVKSGNVYNAYISGAIKGQIGKAGELNGNFSANTKALGRLDKNCVFGNYGYYTSQTKDFTQIKVGYQDEIKPGKAQIYSTVEGTEPQLYDIEIIKINQQDSPNDKGLVIRITDKELIAKTGGIVQGMSGSPIIQNGKLIGAVTHVFTADPTKGYGIFAQWMLEQ